ncbi:unnamed protein product [Onchocerca flexuosa]|uniref:Homeobox domain-containing protein n=1 Tax=Onchocerca flexuosa TaxID=387005 RepID=A0A183HGB7_9BILA|nr:unnamed protein product [Onchocerca flexuosa]
MCILCGGRPSLVGHRVGMETTTIVGVHPTDHKTSSMSNIGSTSGQHGDNATLPQISRKRSSPNSGSLKSEALPTTSVATVGSSSSKLRRVIHSSVEQNPESSDLSRQQNSHLRGTSEAGSVGGGSGRSGSGRSGHESIRSELKYLTDFFPDQNPIDRRLTRSQRQCSTPVSNVSFSNLC